MDTADPAPYAFGDNPTARRRLDVLDQVFRPTTSALLRRLPPVLPRVVLDLGCGPGHTTTLLADRFPEAAVVGLDSSGSFVDEAALAPAGRARFARVDVTRTPFPDAPADVVYARHLLAHLPEPASLVGRWGGQLAPGGLLVLEETAWIRTEDPDFGRYLDLLARLLDARGTQLYVGDVLSGLAPPPGLSIAYRGVATVDATVGQAATLFSLNLATLREDALVRTLCPARELDALASALGRRVDDGRHGVITWGVAQLVLRRPPSSSGRPSR